MAYAGSVARLCCRNDKYAFDACVSNRRVTDLGWVGGKRPRSGAAFVAACNPGREAATWRDPAAPAPVNAYPTPTPTSAQRPITPPTPWVPATPVKPVPGVCPHISGIVDQPGGPQHYLPCHGTDIALTLDDGPSPTCTPQILASHGNRDPTAISAGPTGVDPEVVEAARRLLEQVGLPSDTSITSQRRESDRT